MGPSVWLTQPVAVTVLVAASSFTEPRVAMSPSQRTGEGGGCGSDPTG